MFKFEIKYSFYLILIISVAACSVGEEKGKIALAKVGENTLYLSDVSEFIPTDLGKQDSALMAEDYINKWVRQELLIQKANENLSFEQKDLSREMQEYKNSLIIYKYKNELMKQRMDTLVSENEIETYYNENTENFNLTRNIVKAIFVKIPAEFANPELLKELITNDTDENFEELREYCLRYAKGFDTFGNNWIDFELVKKNIPIQIEKEQEYIARNNLIELNDSTYYYLVRIRDFKLQNHPAPLSFVENNIKNLILNQRKIEFLKELEENVYTEGLRKNKFKIYNLNSNETN